MHEAHKVPALKNLPPDIRIGLLAKCRNQVLSTSLILWFTHAEMNREPIWSFFPHEY
jgi:hypothetical protein